MVQFDAYLVCENGHGVNASFYRRSEFNRNFCSYCGAKTLKSCPSCNADIRGEYHVPNVYIVGDSMVPDICDNCGTDFPWRSKKKKIAEQTTKADKNDELLLDSLIDRFHLVAKQLRERHDDRDTLDIADEYDTQDMLHALLKVYYDDIRPEEWNPSYAGGSSRSDFLLKEQKIIIEVKKTRSGLKSKQVGEQLIIDIARYKTHPDCKTLYCFVYDPEGYISNPRGIENDLNKTDGDLKVKVKIIPKGH